VTGELRFGLVLALASALAGAAACSGGESAPARQVSSPGPRKAPAPPDPLAHTPDFIEHHAALAASDSQACARCHTDSECADCHDARVRPRRVHPNDFLTLHAVAARTEGTACSSCHHGQAFCVNCHQRAGMSESGPVGNFSRRGRFHPPASVWSSGPRTAAHHAWEAQRNLTACVSCHQERDCVTCHATRAGGGPGGLPAGAARGTNPHPTGFETRCRMAFADNPRPCLVCHDPAERALEVCR
jgi:hypothetical protein